MERYLFLIDEKKDYARALAAFFNSDREFACRAVVLTPEEAQEQWKENTEGIVLASTAYEKELLGFFSGQGREVFWLTENRTDRRETAIYRYQSARSILGRVLRTERETGGLAVAAVFSPAGGVQQELLCDRIAEGLARTGRVLYLSLLPFGMEKRGENGMSELLYFARQKRETLSGFLKEQRNYEGNLTKIGAVRWSMDLQKLTPEDLEVILSCAGDNGGFDLVLFAIGAWNEAGLAAMHLCDLLFVPVWETEEGRGIQADFIRQLRESGENRLLRCIRELEMTPMEQGDSLAGAAAMALREWENRGTAGVRD